MLLVLEMLTNHQTSAEGVSVVISSFEFKKLMLRHDWKNIGDIFRLEFSKLVDRNLLIQSPVVVQ